MKKVFLHVLLLTMSLLFVSCNEESIDPVGDEENTVQDDPYFVDQRYAIAMASMMNFPVDSGGIRSTKSEYREVDRIIPFGKDGKPSYYIVNYKDDKGFLIVAADKRIDPVLAFSLSGNFVLDYKDMPSGLVDWMMEANDGIENIRENGVPVELRSGLPPDFEWDNYNPCEWQHIFGPNPELCGTYDPCASRYEGIGPLLKTEWHQRYPYNSALDDCGCTGLYLEGRPPAGCVAIAMVQVMNYHKKPYGVNWNVATSPNGFGYADVIKEAGLVIGMSYGCDGSGADTGKVPNALKSHFGYQSADFRNGFDHNIVLENLKRNQPVILAGNKSNSWSWIGGYGEGHAWVCDGYSKITSVGICPGSGTSVRLHMNWGWGPGKGNGYYGVGEWWKSRTGGDYSENQRMLYNIKP